MYCDREKIELPNGVVQGNYIDIEWLKKASSEEQKEALFQWFTNQYEDPVESLPYNSREGGYIPIHGALVDPFDEFGEFGDIVSDEIIDDVVQELCDIAGDMWSPIPSSKDFYEIKETASLDSFEIRVARVLELLSIKDDFLVKSSVFVLLFTAFETYLWEKTKESLNNSKLNLELNLIKSMEKFKQKILLTDIYIQKIDIKRKLHDVLDKETVWHNERTIREIFEKGFGLDEIPDFSHIKKDIDKRHNIVHRFGMSVDGFDMPLTNEDIYELKNNLIIFVRELETKINEKIFSL